MNFKVDSEATTPGIPKLAHTIIKYEIPISVLSRAPANASASGRGVAPEGIKPFTWDDVSDTKSYEVEVSPSSRFEKSTKRSVGPLKAFAPPEVKPGSMFVRVRALGRKGLLSPPSQIGRLEVTLPPPLLKHVQSKVLKANTPEEFIEAKHSFELAWTPRQFAESYELEWGADREFKQSKTFRSQMTNRNITVTKSSDYAARVRALGPGGVPISPFSPAMVVSFKKDLVVAPVPVISENEKIKQ